VSKIIVGVDPTGRSRDAVALAATLARGSDAELVLVCAYPYDEIPLRFSDGGALRVHLREEAERAIAHARQDVEGLRLVRPYTIPEPSAAKAIQTVAARESAALIVIGSSHRGGLGRVFAGTTAERLLHGAPCPVAVASRGFAEHAGDTIEAIGAAYDYSPESRSALAAATLLARALGSRLHVIHVLDTVTIAVPGLKSGPRYAPPPVGSEEKARARLEDVAAALPDDVDAWPEVLVGEPEHELAVQSKNLDLMVAGSRAYGPHRAVLLGSVSGRLARHAACPVVVVPRGIDAPLVELYAHQANLEEV
jgi:nucleotide-binding universal stress UspA family protein